MWVCCHHVLCDVCGVVSVWGVESEWVLWLHSNQYVSTHPNHHPSIHQPSHSRHSSVSTTYHLCQYCDVESHPNPTSNTTHHNTHQQSTKSTQPPSSSHHPHPHPLIP